MNRINKTILLALLWCLLLLSGCEAPRTDTLEIHMLYVGSADCFLVKQGDAAMLIDGGNPEDANRIVSYLNTHGVDHLDAVILSHPHVDHAGGLRRVIDAYRTDVLYYAQVPQEVEASTLLHTRLFDTAVATGATVSEASNGATFSLGAAQVQIYPVNGPFSDANDYSLFVRVTYGEERVLFTGDATEKAQRAFINSGMDVTADVLKISHHGSKINTTRALLAAVQPHTALISCGVENDYGHPHDDTVLALEERGIACYRSDVGGDTILTITQQGEYFTEAAN